MEGSLVGSDEGIVLGSLVSCCVGPHEGSAVGDIDGPPEEGAEVG